MLDNNLNVKLVQLQSIEMDTTKIADQFLEITKSKYILYFIM